MGSAVIPTQTVQKILIGYASVSNPTIMLKVGGVVYPNGFRQDYNGGYRNFFGGYDGSAVYLVCHSIAYGQDLPGMNLYDVEVLLIG